MKKNRILEIIREEISLAMREGEMEDKAATAAQLKATDLEIKALQKKKAELAKSGVAEISLAEDQLDEMAKIKDMTAKLAEKMNSDLALVEEKIKAETAKIKEMMGVAGEELKKTLG